MGDEGHRGGLHRVLSTGLHTVPVNFTNTPWCGSGLCPSSVCTELSTGAASFCLSRCRQLSQFLVSGKSFTSPRSWTCSLEFQGGRCLPPGHVGVMLEVSVLRGCRESAVVLTRSCGHPLWSLPLGGLHRHLVSSVSSGQLRCGPCIGPGTRALALLAVCGASLCLRRSRRTW